MRQTVKTLRRGRNHIGRRADYSWHTNHQSSFMGVMNTSLRFLVPAAGVVIGVLFGMTIGEFLVVGLEKPFANMQFVCASVGAIVGYFAGYLVERQNR